MLMFTLLSFSLPVCSQWYFLWPRDPKKRRLWERECIRLLFAVVAFWLSRVIESNFVPYCAWLVKENEDPGYEDAFWSVFGFFCDDVENCLRSNYLPKYVHISLNHRHSVSLYMPVTMKSKLQVCLLFSCEMETKSWVIVLIGNEMVWQWRLYCLLLIRIGV